MTVRMPLSTMAALIIGVCLTLFVSNREDQPSRTDHEQEHQPDHTGVGKHLDVEVLDAPLATFSRECEVDDIREPLARVRDVGLEHVWPRRALPANAQDRVVLPDP